MTLKIPFMPATVLTLFPLVPFLLRSFQAVSPEPPLQYLQLFGQETQDFWL